MTYTVGTLAASLLGADPSTSLKASCVRPYTSFYFAGGFCGDSAE